MDLDELAPLELVQQAVRGHVTNNPPSTDNNDPNGSPKTHSRSSSHDSYFERKLSVSFNNEVSEMSEDFPQSPDEDQVCTSPQLTRPNFSPYLMFVLTKL